MSDAYNLSWPQAIAEMADGYEVYNDLSRYKIVDGYLLVYYESSRGGIWGHSEYTWLELSTNKFKSTRKTVESISDTQIIIRTVYRSNVLSHGPGALSAVNVTVEVETEHGTLRVYSRSNKWHYGNAKAECKKYLMPSAIIAAKHTAKVLGLSEDAIKKYVVRYK